MSVKGVQMPNDIKDCIYIYDSKKRETRKVDAKSILKSKNDSFVFRIPLYVKDHSNFQTNQFTIVHLIDSQKYGSQTESGFFPGITLQDILKNKKAQQKVTDTLNLMQKFNVWLDASVAVSNNGLIKITDDTKLKTY